MLGTVRVRLDAGLIPVSRIRLIFVSQVVGVLVGFARENQVLEAEAEFFG